MTTCMTRDVGSPKHAHNYTTYFTLLKMKCRTPAELALFRASVLRIKSAARNISEHFHCAKCRAEAQSCTFEPSILERGARNVRGSRAMTPIR